MSPWTWSWLAGRAGVSGRSWCAVRTWLRSVPVRWRWATRTPSTPHTRPPASCTTGGWRLAPRGQGSGCGAGRASWGSSLRDLGHTTPAEWDTCFSPWSRYPGLARGLCPWGAVRPGSRVPSRCLNYVLEELKHNARAAVMVASHSEDTVRFTLRRWVCPPHPPQCPGLCWKHEAGGDFGGHLWPLDLPGLAGSLAAVAERLPAVPVAFSINTRFPQVSD